MDHPVCTSPSRCCRRDQATLKSNPVLQEHLKVVSSLIEEMKKQPMAIACETLRYWKAKTAYVQDGAPSLVWRTFLVTLRAQGAAGLSLMMQVNLIITTPFSWPSGASRESGPRRKPPGNAVF